MHCKRKTVQPSFGALCNPRFLSIVSGYKPTKKFLENKVKIKNMFLVYGENTYYTISIHGKILIIEFSYNFLYVWNCMKFYERKFPIYENCMISLFGQSGECISGQIRAAFPTTKYILKTFCM